MAVDLPGAGAQAYLSPRPERVAAIERASGQRISLCYQCQKCSGGCPLGFAMDLLPHQFIRYVQMGHLEELWHTRTIWLCAACRTCVARCPNGIDLAAVADALKQEAVRRRLPAKESAVQAFHQAFLASLQNRGRLHELSMLIRYKLKSRGPLTQDLDLGLAMFRRGKLKLLPEGVRRQKEIRALFARAQQGGNGSGAL
ncbi:MAG: 4Fe-4S dicluster domain-containing protein [Clostridia bacterium]|nr:4Fe-4S dicluster domain-containing protein [Clostridia bacterium]